MKKIILVSIVFISFLFACNSSDNVEATNNDSFDRTVLLTNWVDNIIVPSYINYQSKVNTLVTTVTAFNANPSETNLENVRTSWLEAYKAFQKVSAYQIGKAMEISLKEATNTYPTDVAGLEANISSGTYNLDLLSQFSKQGFPALDYLLYGLATTNSDIVAFYTTNSNASNYKQYLNAITNKLKTNADLIISDWNSSFRNTYIANNGNSVSSSVNVTTNLFVKNFEKDIRTGKIGIPAGIFSSGTLYPEKVEGLYSNITAKELLDIAIKSQQDFFNGKHFNSTTTGASLKSYLDFVNAVRNGQKLSDVINNQFTTIYTKNSDLNSNFSEQVTNDNSKMIATYDVLQQQVIYLKLDMMQALNITIDYVDGDGD